MTFLQLFLPALVSLSSPGSFLGELTPRALSDPGTHDSAPARLSALHFREPQALFILSTQHHSLANFYSFPKILVKVNEAFVRPD